MAVSKKSTVYWVDPKKLAVKSCDITKIDETLKDHHSVIIDDELWVPQFMFEDLPKEVKGIHCFGSEEEAHCFVKIKIQIGM